MKDPNYHSFSVDVVCDFSQKEYKIYYILGKRSGYIDLRFILGIVWLIFLLLKIFHLISLSWSWILLPLALVFFFAFDAWMNR